jgi:hypothetical protein
MYLTYKVNIQQTTARYIRLYSSRKPRRMQVFMPLYGTTANYGWERNEGVEMVIRINRM